MSPHPTTLLSLVLCLGQRSLTQEGALPRASISAEPGSVIPRGRPVTIVCRGPAGAQDFRLEKRQPEHSFWDRKSSPSEPEARFPFPSMSEDTAGIYRCHYVKSGLWSAHSEDLELVLSREDVTQGPTPVPAQPSGAPCDSSPPPTEVSSPTASTLQNYTGLNCVRLGLAGLVLVVLVVILGEAWHSWHRSQKGESSHQRA